MKGKVEAFIIRYTVDSPSLYHAVEKFSWGTLGRHNRELPEMYCVTIYKVEEKFFFFIHDK